MVALFGVFSVFVGFIKQVDLSWASWRFFAVGVGVAVGVAAGVARSGPSLALALTLALALALGGSSVGCGDSLLELRKAIVGGESQGAGRLFSTGELGSEGPRVEVCAERLDAHAAEDLGGVGVHERDDGHLDHRELLMGRSHSRQNLVGDSGVGPCEKGLVDHGVVTDCESQALSLEVRKAVVSRSAEELKAGLDAGLALCSNAKRNNGEGGVMSEHSGNAVKIMSIPGGNEFTPCLFTILRDLLLQVTHGVLAL